MAADSIPFGRTDGGRFYEDSRSRRIRAWERDNHLCHWCGCLTYLTKETIDVQATEDHVIPRYKGGSSDDDNVVNACRLCNNRRNHEDQRGLPEGSLLGVFKMNKKPVCLTKEDKQRLFGGPVLAPDVTPAVVRVDEHSRKLSTSVKGIDVMHEQRDQALLRVRELEKQVNALTQKNKFLADKLTNMTVWRMIRYTLVNWIRPKEKV